MQGSKDQVSRLRCPEGYFYGLQVPHLSHKDRIRVLTKRSSQSIRKTIHIFTYLPLIYYTLSVVEHILYWVLYGYYVMGEVFVYVVDQSQWDQ